ncbi:MAG: penicillin-binding protein [Myxococcota bacterium]
MRTTPGRASERIRVPTIGKSVESHESVMKTARGRVWVLAGLFGVALMAIGGRAAMLCVDPDEQTVALGSQQRWEQMTLRAKRGSIFDRDGNRLVVSVDTPDVIADPRQIHPNEVDGLAAEVAALLGLPVDQVAEKMRRDSSHAPLARKVHPKVVAQLRELKHPGLFHKADQRRYYAEQDLGSHVLGYVNGAGEGRAGIERAMEDHLRGSSVLLQRRRDRRGLDVDRMRDVDRASTAGMDVHLTLDREIQRITERAVRSTHARTKPLSVTAVVVDVATGDLLALANSPGFNPNSLPSDQSLMRNHAVMDAIEPGSVVKPFLIAGAIEDGEVSLTTAIDCEKGRWKIGRRTIHDDHPKSIINVSDVIKYSSNIGSAKISRMLGAERHLGYMQSFGFGEPTGIELPGERRGKLRDPKTIKPIELATTSFGQGMTATALQLAYATATLGNDGVRMRPRLVTKVIDEDGVPAWVSEPEAVKRVVSVQTARDVRSAMISVTQRGGTGTRARVPGYEVAGKTGTAQKVEGGRGYTDARIGSFVGFVPANDPKLAIVVIVDDPQVGLSYGGVVAGPAFAEIAELSLRHLGVAPDPALLEDEEATPIEEEPADVEEVVVADLGLSDEGWILPNLGGQTVREALVALQGTGLSVQVEGSGRLAAMSPPAGARLAPGSTVRLTFH